MVVRYHIKVDLSKQGSKPGLDRQKSNPNLLNNKHISNQTDKYVERPEDVFMSPKKTMSSLSKIGLSNNRSISILELSHLRKAVLLIGLGVFILCVGLGITIMHFRFLYVEKVENETAENIRKRLDSTRHLVSMKDLEAYLHNYNSTTRQSMSYSMVNISKYSYVENSEFETMENASISPQQKIYRNVELLRKLEGIQKAHLSSRASDAQYIYNYLLKLLGPIFLALGILIIICGLVWMPVIREKFKKKRQERERKLNNDTQWRSLAMDLTKAASAQ